MHLGNCFLGMFAQREKCNLHEYFESCSREFGVGVGKPVVLEISCWYSPPIVN